MHGATPVGRQLMKLGKLEELNDALDYVKFHSECRMQNCSFGSAGNPYYYYLFISRANEQTS
jgi:hypothetical protein